MRVIKRARNAHVAMQAVQAGARGALRARAVLRAARVRYVASAQAIAAVPARVSAGVAPANVAVGTRKRRHHECAARLRQSVGREREGYRREYGACRENALP